MSENILNRIGRIIAGSVHSLSEKLVNQHPDDVLNEAIVEIDQAISETKAELGKLEVQKHDLQKIIEKLQQELEPLNHQIQLAFDKGKEELVKVGLGRQIDLENQIKPLRNQVKYLETFEEDFTAAINGLVARRNQMEDDLHHFKKAQEEGESEFEMDPTNIIPQILKADNAEAKFNRVVERISARVSHTPTTESDAEMLIELANLEREAQIEAKLKTLKDARSLD